MGNSPSFFTLAFVVAMLLAPDFAGVAAPTLLPRRAPAFGATGTAAAQDAMAVERSLGLDRLTRRLIQQGLRNEGFDAGPPDGLFGPRTRQAIRHRQEARGLPANGYLDGAEAEFFRAAAGPPPGVQTVETTQPATVESAAASVEALNCEAWNTEAFFESATASVVRACLDAGADPGAVDVHSITLLHRAAAISEDPAVIEALLAAGADPTTRTQEVDTPLDDDAGAVIADRISSAHGTDYQFFVAPGDTPLHYAAQFNENPAVLDVLVAVGADVHARDRDGWTPLHRAAATERPAVIEALLAAGAVVDAREQLGHTPLHFAGFSESPAAVEALLAAGADVHAREKQGFTPLHRAAGRSENPAVLEVFLAAGAEVNARDDSGRTPLHQAAGDSANPAVVEALLVAGADLTARSRPYGWTPLHRAAGYSEHPAVVEVLVAAGADLAAPDEYGDTPLHTAVQYNENPVVIIEALLAAGGDAAALSGNGKRRTPLHRVAYNRTRDENAVVEVLLNAGASVDARDIDGNTPLHIAARFTGSPWGHGGPAIEALLDAGADPTALNAAGETPWDLAQENRVLELSAGYRRLEDARLSAPRRD